MAVVLGVTSLTGYTAGNMGFGTGNAARAMRFTAAANATVNSLEFYFDSSYDGDARVKLFIANTAGTRLGLTGAIVASAAGGDAWVGGSVTPFSIVAGQQYDIGLYVDNTYGSASGRLGVFGNGTGCLLDTTSGTYTTPPTTFSLSADAGSPSFAIRASSAVAPAILSSATPNYLGSLTITGTGFPTSQSGSAGITIGGAAQTVTWNTATSCSISSVDIGTNKYGTSVDIIVTDASGNASSGYATTFSARSGGASVDLLGTMASSGVRLVASPDIAAGDQIEYYGATGGTIPTDVTVNSDGTYDTADAVTGFYWRVWTTGGGWGTAGFETVTHPAESSSNIASIVRAVVRTITQSIARGITNGLL